MSGGSYRPPIDAATKATIIAAYEAGERVNTIAKEAHVARQTVINTIQAAGIQKARGRPLPPPEIDEDGEIVPDEKHSWRRIVREHHRHGTPVPVLARQYVVGEDYIRFCLRRAGFAENSAPSERRADDEVCA